MVLALLLAPIVAVHVYPSGSISAALAELKAKANGAACQLHLHGTFPLTSPIIVEGFKGLAIIGHDRATLSGGTVIPAKAWRRTTFLGHAVYEAPFSSSHVIHEAWSGSVRLHRPTLPKTGFWNFAGYLDGSEKSEWNKGQSHMRFAANTVAPWHNLEDVELVAHTLWITSRLPVKSVSGDVVEFTKPSVFKLGDDYTGGAAPFRAENVAEALDGKNEFYIDRAAKSIYVSAATWPQRAGDLVLPTTAQVLRIKGSDRVTVREVQFSHTEWCYPGETSGDVQAAMSVPGAVEVSSSKDCDLDHCQFTNLGTYALEINAGSVGCAVRNSDLIDLGGGGVKIASGTSHSTVENCIMTGGGRLHAPAVGVWIADSGYNTISRNLISDFYYTGVSIGWVWGYGPSQGNHNVIERNVIHTIGQRELSDMGAIYNLGVSPGTIIRENLIANVQSHSYGGWGIYLDEGSSGVLVEHNAVFGVRTGTFHQHYGRDNIVTHNLLCGAEREGQIIRSRHEDHTSFSLLENLILWKGTELFAGSPGGGGLISEGNLLARLDAEPTRPDFDTTSRSLAPTDKVSVDGWLLGHPGSKAWWSLFGPSRGEWKKAILPFIQPWLNELGKKLGQ